MPNVDKEQIRGDAYRLLAACFYTPEIDMFLSENLCPNLEKTMAKLCPGAVPATQAMGQALSDASEESLQAEHAALFVGPFELKAPPYGSVYLEKARKLMGDSTMEANKFYQNAGLALDLKDAPDHIAFELEFMGYLAGMTKKNLMESDEEGGAVFNDMQTDFLHRFLAEWVPDFTTEIRNNTTNDFYLSLADCLEQFIRWDYERFDGTEKRFMET